MGCEAHEKAPDLLVPGRNSSSAFLTEADLQPRVKPEVVDELG
jgi:hypothetical protein